MAKRNKSSSLPFNSASTVSDRTQSGLQRILVFDSGVGGLSICQEIMIACEDIEIHYLSDNKGFPYGETPEQQLIANASALLLTAVQLIKPALVVIACNTASTVVLPSLREKINVPIVGVVPAIKTAAQLSKSFALLATPATISRRYTDDLIATYASDKTVIKLGSSELVRHIEAHLHGDDLDRNLLIEIINQIKQQAPDQAIDTVVLGCTHFPLIKTEFERIQPDWKWIDSGRAIANRVKEVLDQNDIKSMVKEKKRHSAWLTEWHDGDQLKALFDRYGFERLKTL